MFNVYAKLGNSVKLANSFDNELSAKFYIFCADTWTKEEYPQHSVNYFIVEE